MMNVEGVTNNEQARPADARPNGFVRAGQSDGEYRITNDEGNSYDFKTPVSKPGCLSYH